MSQPLSTKQLIANRENAKFGGVKTPEGRAISKLNAIKHGLLSREVLLSGEDEQDLVELGKRMRDYVKPIGELELILTERVVSSAWRLKRVLRVEKATMEWQKRHVLGETRWGNSDTSDEQVALQAEGEMITGSGIEKISRYEALIERGLYKALHELQRVQSARLGDRPPAPLAVDVEISS